MRLGKPSAVWAILLLSGCAPEPEPDRVLRVEVHLPAATGAAPPDLSIELTALGDFEGSAFTSKIAPGSARALPLPFPGSTRAVSALAQGDHQSFSGVGSADSAGNIDVLLWRTKDSTPLWPAGDASFPEQATGMAFGVHGRHLLAAGSLSASADASRAFTVDLATGRASEVAEGMLGARAFASVTAFGSELMLVAGGVDPTLSPSDLAAAPPLDTATEYDVKKARFDRTRVIPLAQPRARHAAVVLASGETLLVGGAGPNGVALGTLEAVSPKDHASRSAGLATLKQPRIAPIALRLSDDRVFVGGGSSAVGTVNVLEWLSPDARVLSFIQESFVVAEAHGFAAMPGGGVLAVGVCVPKGVPSCLTPAQSVTWLRADGSADVLPSLSFAPTQVALVAANDGAPWLFARTSAAVLWKRFDPWTGRFDEPKTRPLLGPDPDLPAPLGVDAGAFVWLERAGAPRLAGFRHDVRGPFARDVAPLLLAGRENVAPNRFPSGVSQTGIEYSGAGLGLSGEDTLAVVADTSYADFDLELTLTSGPPPVVVLGVTRVGGDDCPWRSLDAAAPGEVLKLFRRGDQATLERSGERRACPIDSGRLSVGLSAAGPSASFVRALEIHRR